MIRAIILLAAFVSIFASGVVARRPIHTGSQLADSAFAQFVPVSQDEPRPLPSTKYVRSRNFDTKHISLDLRFKWETSQTIGVERFTFSPLTPNFKTLNLDAGNMIFKSVKMADGTDLEFSYDHDKSALSIQLDRAYGLSDDLTVVIEYQTTGDTVGNTLGFGGGGGLKFIKPSKNEPDKPWQIWSQGESEYNRYWFPSYDYPNDFRSTEITATVKKPLMVISNGKLMETTDNGDNTRTYRWRMDTPYASYLTSIVVGEYSEIRGDFKGKPVSTYVYKNWKNEGEVTAKRLPEMVSFFSKKLGLDYPYSKYAQTIAHEFGGGMENITATTQTDNMIIDARTELDNDQDGLQAHELAHQWFGNYVTCRDWSEIWLNESFATYLESLWQGHSKGHDYFLYNEVRSNQNGYFGAWNQGQRRPIVTKNYANPDSVFDSYAYARGGAVLHMLRKELGDDDFFRALNHYLKSNANEPVQTEDLRIAIEESTGRSMDRFFDQWLYRMGHPVFDVKQSYDAVTGRLTLNVKQTQKRDITSLYPQVKYFEMPVDIEIITANGTKIETVMVKPIAENEFTFDLDGKPLLVDFDNEGTLIKEIKFEKSLDDLMYQARNDKDILGRGWAMSELAGKAAAKDASSDLKSKVISFIRETGKNEPTWQLRRAAIQRTRTLVVPRTAPGQTVSKLVLDAETSNALVAAAGDSDSRVRSQAISLLGLTQDPTHYNLYRKSAMSDQSYDVIDAAAIAMARTKHDDAYSVLRVLAQTDSWRGRVQVAGLNALAELGDKNALDLGFKYATAPGTPANVRNAGLSIVGSVGGDNPKAFDLIFTNFKSALERSAFQSMFTGLRAIIRLADPRGQQAFDLMKAKFKDNPQFMGFINMQEAQFKAGLKK
jgi:aminopeptidase N